MTICGLDLGTSNSAIGVVKGNDVLPTPVEGSATTIPTAVFFSADPNHSPSFGRKAMNDYIEEADGRLMRSLTCRGSEFLSVALGLTQAAQRLWDG